MLRNPSFEDDLSRFLRKYPVFFRFQKKYLHSYGTVEKEVTQQWVDFLKKNAARLAKVEESDEAIVYKYVLGKAHQSVDLEQWEKEVRRFDIQLWMAAGDLHGEKPKWPVFSRVSEHRSDFLREISTDYLFLARCKPQDFELAEKQFARTWNVFPHHLRPPEKAIVVFREQVPQLDRSIQLFIPISDVTTEEELERGWSEVVSMQKVFYARKKRPGRTAFETLLKIYDLRSTLSSEAVAKKLGISPSSVEKHYRRVHRDIHGITPQRAPRQEERLRGRRKTRLAFEEVAKMHGITESQSDVLRTVFVEQSLPLDKLDDLRKLTTDQRKLLQDGLRARTLERHRRGF